MSVEFDSMQEYAREAVAGFFTHIGITDVQNLQVSVIFDEQSETDYFTITADSFTYNNTDDGGVVDIQLTFTDGVLTTSSGLSGGIPGLDEASFQQWYEFFDPDKNDEYAKSAAEELLRQVGIENFNNVVASASFDEDGNDNITINLDQNIDFQSESGIYVYEISLQFSSEGSIVTKFGIPTELKDAFSDSALEVWYEYSGPDQQRQKDQQEGGYFDGDSSHQETHSNVYTWEDWEGTVWTVVDKDVDGTWSSTQTGSNGDTRINSSTWNNSTQTNTFTEVFTSSSRGINSTMVEESGPNGATKTYTGTADGIGWMPLHEIYTSMNVVETLDQYWNTTNITGTAVNSDKETVTFTYANNELLIDGESIQMDFGFDDHFASDQTNEWEWTDDWNNTIWAVVEKDVDGVWTSTETAYQMNDDGSRGDATGNSRTSSSSWNDTTKVSTWTMHEVNLEMGFDFTRAETWNEETGLSSETITGTFDQIGWYFLGQTYDGINATVERDANWNVTNISGTVQDPDNSSATLAVTFSNNDILIDGESVSDMQDNQPHFKEGEANEWSWTDWEGVTWNVVDEEKATDIVSIIANGSKIVLTFDVDNNTLLSTSGVSQDVTGLEESSLLAWYPSDVIAHLEQHNLTDEEERTFAEAKILDYVNNHTNLSGVVAADIRWDISDTMSSTETGSNGDVRTHTSSWDDATNSSTMTETYVSGNLEQNYTRTEIWRDDGTSTETITGKTNQLGWMRLDGIYENINVEINHTWDGMTIEGSGVNSDNVTVTFTLNENEELLVGGVLVDTSSMDFNMNESQDWNSSWEWTDWDGTVWVVTDEQKGDTWSSTEIAYTEDEAGNRTVTGAEREHSSTYNENTKTNIWIDSEKSADGETDFARVETQRADGTSTEKITGKTDKFGDYDNVEITISRDSSWNVTDISGTADGLAVTSDDSGNILIGGVAVDTFNKDAGGGHANMENSESSWTWTDWDGVTWTVTDKQEGDTWTSTESGDNGDVRVHKNSWSGETETWSDSFTAADGSIDVTRVEVRNSTNNTSTETITK